MTLPKPPNPSSIVAEISVVIPAYNARDTIERALRSVAVQSLKPHEVVVVDDGSTDGTFEAAQEFVSQMDGISLIVIKQENKGAGAARNRALKESSQPIIAFLDADDEWLPEKLERSLYHMEAGGYTLVGHNGYIVEDGKESIIDGARRYREGTSPYVSLYRKGYLDTCTVVARREALLAAGGFDESLPNAQDFELWLRLLKDPQTKFLVFDEVLSRYHVMPGSIMSHTERRLSCCLDIAGRYAPYLSRYPGIPIVGLWYRVAAIHYEAAITYWNKMALPQCFALCLRLPISLIISTIEYILKPQHPREDCFKLNTFNGRDRELKSISQGVISTTIYIWVVAALGLYLYQFKHIAGPILKLVGLS